MRKFEKNNPTTWVIMILMAILLLMRFINYNARKTQRENIEKLDATLTWVQEISASNEVDRQTATEEFCHELEQYPKTDLNPESIANLKNLTAFSAPEIQAELSKLNDLYNWKQVAVKNEEESKKTQAALIVTVKSLQQNLNCNNHLATPH